MTTYAELTVGELARGIRGATRIFERNGIDYCCGGGTSLADACSSAGIALDGVLVELRGLEGGPNAGAPPDATSMSLTELVAHIVDTHHVYTTTELARLGRLVTKVVDAHGDRHPELHDIARLFDSLRDDLLPHLFKEENVLFPYVVELDRASRSNRAARMAPFGTVHHPIEMMMREHDTAGDLLRALRTTSGDYRAPVDACGSYRALYEGLADLERDLHEHIHLENNVLFPKAIEIEER